MIAAKLQITVASDFCRASMVNTDTITTALKGNHHFLQQNITAPREAANSSS
jgi:hypothetical protein